jgi:hypothetical protein
LTNHKVLPYTDNKELYYNNYGYSIRKNSQKEKRAGQT